MWGQVSWSYGPMDAAAAGMDAEWRTQHDLVEYQDALAAMEQRVADIRAGTAPELVWLLEHPPVYTAGTSAAEDELLDAGRFPVHRTGRGGRYTYHGPGQRITYVMLDLKRRGPDVRQFVRNLEGWVIAVLNQFGVTGERRDGRVGIWVAGPDGTEEKIAAIGVRIRHWVTFHGIAINVNPELEHFNGIIPCGIAGYGVTSLSQLGVTASLEDVDAVLRKTFASHFGS
ncbi:MAG: lipoyl(octanoyl) transferase LipB [Rhodospirillaceae bacterium]|nr:lipoyl(octanoyl) transferase LipB [Rhodospirillaceae bacterium]MBT4117247.1 lipoyl(octanoyl) transferase LipB [Rhodospirillaceae bacterium]MBT4674880.1 lipoyl(octanoyl) transferase LipB [Rhodospirillaceae bacterium]MBT4747878.1 lipoyl(octanoyl) transferase LipB [Rhodospirillaceae bacterium]MBT5179331.1 lipoyl(octanoyl) transferase LipB [Rhodospirillaceae bacterium]